jgi:hypothetical protein
MVVMGDSDFKIDVTSSHLHDWQEVDRIETLDGSAHVAQECRQCCASREFVVLPTGEAVS